MNTQTQQLMKQLKCGHVIPTDKLITWIEAGNMKCPHPDCDKVMFYKQNGEGFYLPCFLIHGELYFGTWTGSDMEFRLPVTITSLDDGDEIGWWAAKEYYGTIKYVRPGEKGEFSEYYFNSMC